MLQSLRWLLLAPTRSLLWVRRRLIRLLVTVAAVAAGWVYGLWGLWVLLGGGSGGRRDTKEGRNKHDPPPGLEDGTYGRHGWIRMKSSGLRLHYVTRGPPTAPLLLLLHGFPQNWFCWRHQLLEFSPRFRVVALDLRGCGASEKPLGVENYSPEILIGDIREAIGALVGQNGTHKCILVGHDWGGVLAWELAAAHPEMVTKLVVMDAPHRAVMTGFSLLHPTQLLRSSYIFLFQLRWLPELLLSLNNFHDVTYGVKAGDGARIGGVSIWALTAGGLSPPINYYRNLFGDSPVPRERPPCPVLILWGGCDPFLDPRLAPYLQHRMAPSAQLHIIPHAGHWLPEDHPDVVNGLLWDFLGGRE